MKASAKKPPPNLSISAFHVILCRPEGLFYALVGLSYAFSSYSTLPFHIYSYSFPFFFSLFVSFQENEENLHSQIEQEEEDEEYTPEELLLDSSRYGEDDILQQVLEAGVDLSVQDENGNTALHLGL